MQSIGIGVTTYERPQVFELFMRQLDKFCPKDYKLHVAKDIPNVSQAKNECLKTLQDCDHIFLFDDDCFPIADNWTDYFIKSNLSHTLYMKSQHNAQLILDDYTVFNDCSGVFMYLTKEVVIKVGYFGDYGRYGFEHAGYSHRINKAGLTPYKYICLNDTNKYIHSLDLEGPFEGIEAKPTLTPQEAIKCINDNRNIFLNEITD